jgi:hypothetical protein
VSRNSSGAVADGSSFDLSISASGRFVAFQSNANNLPSGDGTTQHTYVRDLKIGTTRLVSKTSDGDPAVGFSPSLSGDGRYVAFPSTDADLPAGDGSTQQIYVHDRETGNTRLASKNSRGEPASSSCSYSAMSSNGQVVVFTTDSDNFPGGDGAISQAYARDLAEGRTRLVSANNGGEAAAENSYDPSPSGTGRYVTFYTDAENMPGNSMEFDVFIRDLEARTTRVLSKNSSGAPSNGQSEAYDPVLSRNGRWGYFRSDGTNLPGYEGSIQVYVRGPLD